MWTLALSTGFVGFLRDLRGSTHGRKSLSGGNKHTQSEWQRRTPSENFQHVDIIFSSRVCLAEGGAIQRCRATLTHLTAAAPSPSSRERPPSQSLLLRPVQAAVGCWQPTSVQSTMAEIIHPVFPLKIKLNITSGSFPSPTLYFDMPYL